MIVKRLDVGPQPSWLNRWTSAPRVFTRIYRITVPHSRLKRQGNQMIRLILCMKRMIEKRARKLRTNVTREVVR